MAARTSSRIVIAAPRPDVMAVIADFAAYPQWASAVRAAEVLEQEDGRASRVRFTLDAGVVKDTYVLGYEGGGTETTYELSVDLRIPMPGMLKRRAEKTIIDTALKGLKERVESRPGDGGDS